LPIDRRVLIERRDIIVGDRPVVIDAAAVERVWSVTVTDPSIPVRRPARRNIVRIVFGD
jgi:hypothetical protein